MSRDIAILHSRWTGSGGGPRVVAELARTFDAPVYAGYLDESVVPSDVDARRLSQSWLDRFAYDAVYTGPLPGQDLYDAQRYSHIPDLADVDVLIITDGGTAWYTPTDEQTVIRYIHAPTRWVYDRWQTRDTHLLRRFYAEQLRSLFTSRASYPDQYVANSDVVARRTRQYLSRSADVTVVYPPVDTSGFPEPATEGYALHLGRLDSSKRIGLCIRAAAAADHPLVIAGTGDDRQRLERIASKSGADVDFRGYVDEREKRELLAAADVTLFAGVQEDFGIVPVESMAAGTPVVGVDEGMTQYQIKHGQTGYRCPATADGLAAGLERVTEDGVDWPAERIRAYARENFSAERFRDQMRSVVDAACTESSVEPDIREPAEVKYV